MELGAARQRAGAPARQRARSWELGAGSWEFGTGSCELGVVSWELKAGSCEPGARSCDLALRRAGAPGAVQFPPAEFEKRVNFAQRNPGGVKKCKFCQAASRRSKKTEREFPSMEEIARKPKSKFPPGAKTNIKKSKLPAAGEKTS